MQGLGFWDERFTEPYFFEWTLDEEVSRSLAPAVVPLRPFCGVMGVAQAETGEFRTRPPGEFGGNMDVRELSAGATLYLPVMVEGGLFSAGDAHAAQGDGEVCINGMECPADVTLRFGLHKQKHIPGPIVESAARTGEDGPAWVVVESGIDAFETAQRATSRMVDLLVERWGFEPVQAYLLCSVAMKLRLSQGGQPADGDRERGGREERSAGEEAVLTINDPEVHAELSGLYPAYERALVENDVETLTRMFWGSEFAMRFGVGENLYGVDEIEAFRKARPAVGLARTVARLDIVTFGKDFGSVTLEFSRGDACQDGAGTAESGLGAAAGGLEDRRSTRLAPYLKLLPKSASCDAVISFGWRTLH